MIVPDLVAARATLSAMGNYSHTTNKFQDDLMSYAEDFADQGDCIIEVGCFRGGLTAQFALIGKRLGLHVHVIDIDSGHLEITRQSVAATSGAENVSFHLCDLDTFVKGPGADVRPSLALIDGDHSYRGVVTDIRSLLAMRTRPYGVAFHDYSLRWADDSVEIGVNRAIHDMLGSDFPHVPIGEISREGGALQTSPRDGDQHYHEIGHSEGVMVEFRKLPQKFSFAR